MAYISLHEFLEQQKSNDSTKEFDLWNIQKQRIHIRESVYCNQREIWWCAFGFNIGSEQNGKHDIFERPVLIIKVFNKELCRVIPLTSSRKDDRYHVIINYEQMSGSLILSQMKTISTKRLSRKMCRLDINQFCEVINKIIYSFSVEIPCVDAEDFSEPEGLVT